MNQENTHLPPCWQMYVAAPIPSLLIDKDELIVAANEACGLTLGLPCAALVGLRLDSLRFRNTAPRAADSPDALTVADVSYRRGSGSEIWVTQWAWEIETGISLVQMFDITEKKQSEFAQAMHLDLLSRYADAVPGMVAYWTSELRCAYANGAYLEWFGKAPHEMPGIRMQDLLGERLFALNEPYIRGALGGKLQQFERTLTKANGEVGYTWAQYVPDDDNGQIRGFFVLVSDITKLKTTQIDLLKANQALELRRREAEAANRAKSAFLSMVSHELRSPLHTILGYTELLLRDHSIDKRTHLSIVEHSGKRLLRLIDDILEFNSGNSESLGLHPVALSLFEFADQIANAGAILARKRNNRFSVEIDRTVPAHIEIDEQRLNQIVMNLIENACKFTEKGCVQLQIRAQPRKKSLIFSVIDNGPGIPTGHRSKIFEPFARLPEHAHHPGIGLGLAIVRQIVQAMEGKIVLRTTPGKGSQFDVTLPLKTADVLPRQERHEHTDEISGYEGKRKTLLIADDIPENLHLLAAILTRWGFGVIPANSGKEAIAAFKKAPEKIDAAIIDQIMAEGDAWDFLKHIRASAYRQLPVILISAQRMKRPKHCPESVKFDAFVKKPASSVVLANVLTRTLQIQWHSPTPPVRLAAGSETVSLIRPTASQLRSAQKMLALGQVVAIDAWAAQLIESKPKLRAFGEAIRQYCASIDLIGLGRLLNGLGDER